MQPLLILLLGTLGGLFHLDLFLFQHAAQPQHTALRQLRQSLGGWEEDGSGNVLRPPLGGRVEQAHGVDLVPPELRPHRRFRRRRKHVQQVAAQGELPRPFHLVAPGVPGGHQTAGQLFQVAVIPQREGQRRLFQQFRRQGALQQPFYRSHHQGRLVVGHGVEQIQPTVLPLTGSCGVVKDKLSPGQQAYWLPSKSSQIGLEPRAFLLVRAEQHHAAPSDLPHGGGDVGTVDAGQAGDGDRAVTALRLCQQFLKFRLFDNDFSEFFHASVPQSCEKQGKNPTTTPPEHKLRG